MSEKHKLTFELADKALQQLTWMSEELDARSLGDVVRGALSLQKMLLEHKDWKIILEKGSKRKEILFTAHQKGP